ncbi:hypothetical protein LOTGIDRAFT_233511 [Lottia gigantea]|uniref:Uncharacterized protein n=1 Tax=Lottia gigantea TaxID=225164 RepID=V3ZIB0_LOTGI|nr:hypothetical protein LOTGIDRAFT_233511 [Lottia gigantea]ESO91013.1 hypothetical protein LOTGIDRAFT_233511 [Lottia gigantea]
MKMNVCNPQPIIEECDRDFSGTSNAEVDFSEYMWMGEELEEFDRQVEEELWEEAFIEACFDEMMAEEKTRTNGRTRQPRQQQQFNTNNNNYQRQQQQQSQPSQQHHQQYVYDNNMANIEDSMKMFNLGENKVKAEVVKNSCLNPEAPEFVPGNFMKR